MRVLKLDEFDCPGKILYTAHLVKFAGTRVVMPTKRKSKLQLHPELQDEF